MFIPAWIIFVALLIWLVRGDKVRPNPFLYLCVFPLMVGMSVLTGLVYIAVAVVVAFTPFLLLAWAALDRSQLPTIGVIGAAYIIFCIALVALSPSPKTEEKAPDGPKSDALQDPVTLPVTPGADKTL